MKLLKKNIRFSSFEDFTNESLNQYFPGVIEPFMIELFEKLESAMENTEHQFAGSFKKGDFWWCAKDDESFYVVGPGEPYSVSLLLDAERREAKERSKLPSEKELSQYYLFEIKTEMKNVSSFSLCGVDMKNKEAFSTNKVVEKIFMKVFDDLMKKYYPGMAAGKKYGL